MTFRTIIAHWGSAETLAADIGSSGVTVRAWRNRDSIPASRWLEIVAAARSRGFDSVTLDALAHAAAGGGAAGREDAA